MIFQSLMYGEHLGRFMFFLQNYFQKKKYWTLILKLTKNAASFDCACMLGVCFERSETLCEGVLARFRNCKLVETGNDLSVTVLTETWVNVSDISVVLPSAFWLQHINVWDVNLNQQHAGNTLGVGSWQSRNACPGLDQMPLAWKHCFKHNCTCHPKGILSHHAQNSWRFRSDLSTVHKFITPWNPYRASPHSPG